MPQVVINKASVQVILNRKTNRLLVRPYNSEPKWNKTFGFDFTADGAAAMIKLMMDYFDEVAPIEYTE